MLFIRSGRGSRVDDDRSAAWSAIGFVWIDIVESQQCEYVCIVQLLCFSAECSSNHGTTRSVGRW